jgi:tellurite resistance protein TerC
MQLWLWAGFLALILALLLLDLLFVNRGAHAIPVRVALGWTAFYSALAVAFGGLVYLMFLNGWAGAGVEFGVGLAPSEAALRYLAAWLLEQSLSLDNVFVIALVFAYFQVPIALQHRVLFWGILGVIGTRGPLIAAGALLIQRFAWIEYVLGAVLLWSAWKLLRGGEEQVELEKNVFVRLFRRIYPVTEGFRGTRFFVVENGRRLMTPLFLALVVVDWVDLLFAVDSIPAVFGVTTDAFLVFTSNVFAILGLRSLYFALAGLMERFHHVKHALVFILAFVGCKMLIAHWYEVPVLASLAVIACALLVGVLASLRRPAPGAGAT